MVVILLLIMESFDKSLEITDNRGLSVVYVLVKIRKSRHYLKQRYDDFFEIHLEH